MRTRARISTTHWKPFVVAFSATLAACASSSSRPPEARPTTSEGSGGIAGGVHNDRQSLPPKTPDSPPGADGVGPVSLRSAPFDAGPLEIGGTPSDGGNAGSGGRIIVNVGGGGAGPMRTLLALHSVPR